MSAVAPTVRRTLRVRGQAALRALRVIELLARTRRVPRDREVAPLGHRHRRGECGAGPRRAAGPGRGPAGRDLAGDAPAPAASGRPHVCGGSSAGRGLPAKPVTEPTNPSPATARSALLAVGPRADEDSSAGYRLRSRCLWCREPIGWDCPVGLWVHLRSDGVPCRNLVFAWAAADPQFITITPGRCTWPGNRPRRTPPENRPGQAG